MDYANGLLSHYKECSYRDVFGSELNWHKDLKMNEGRFKAWVGNWLLFLPSTFLGSNVNCFISSHWKRIWTFSVCVAFHPFIHPTTRSTHSTPLLCTSPSMHILSHSCVHAFMHASMYPSIHPSIYPCMHLCTHLSIHPSILTSTHPPTHRLTNWSIHASMHPPSIY